MKVKDGIQAVQKDILVHIRAILSLRDDYDTISKELTMDYLNAKTLDAFIIKCIIKYHIHYKDLPVDYYNNVNFLVKLCKQDLQFLNELVNCNIMLNVIKKLNISTEDMKMLKLSTRREIKRLQKEFDLEEENKNLSN